MFTVRPHLNSCKYFDWKFLLALLFLAYTCSARILVQSSQWLLLVVPIGKYFSLIHTFTLVMCHSMPFSAIQLEHDPLILVSCHSVKSVLVEVNCQNSQGSHFRVLILFLFLFLGSEPNVMPFNYDIRRTFPSELVYLVPNRWVTYMFVF